MHLDDIVPFLQLSIGPVIVISGVGLLLLSMTNRYGRVIDRTRFVADAVRQSAGGGSRMADLRAQLERGGCTYRTRTDTETLPHLYELHQGVCEANNSVSRLGKRHWMIQPVKRFCVFKFCGEIRGARTAGLRIYPIII